jgi:cytochrome c oxidase cbb3-type subunit III
MRLTYLIPFTLAGILCAQAPAPPAARPARPPAYPERPPADPAVVARGKATFGVHCSFCHGSDARGGEGGPNLIRSELVLNDRDGEKIAPVVQNGRPDRGMPKFDLSASAISDIATYIHSFKVGGYDISRQKPVSILVGDAKAGEAYFGAKCASCHSVTGDLKGFGAKFSDPRTLQQTWLAPGGAGRRGPGEDSPVQVKPITVTVTLPSGEKLEGRLVRVDDFIVILTKADGTQSSFRRDGDSPKVEVHDPTQPHRDLLATYTDKDIHNLTAYLVTLK